MRQSLIKNVTFGWMVGMIDHIKHKPDMIINGLGILDAIFYSFT